MSGSPANIANSRTLLTAAVKQAAYDCGFDAVGIAMAEPLTSEVQRFHEWIDRGYHGTMSWMERGADKRADVAVIVPEARSVVVVGHTYDTAERHPPEATGKLSRYAWGDDYHDVLAVPLANLAAKMKELDPSMEHRRYIDTGPVLEKQWAVRAGLGWQGKHSNILRRDIGSFFFLGVVISTMDLDPDEPMADHCGTCTACIDACPTKAIVEPYVVDARRCISYWTIETKPDVEFPEDIRSNLDGWLYGCDVCQDVCPWNRFRKETTVEAFRPRYGQTFMKAEDVVTLQPSEFSLRFRHSPIKRAKHAGMVRNARALLSPQQQHLPCNTPTSPSLDLDQQDLLQPSTPAELGSPLSSSKEANPEDSLP